MEVESQWTEKGFMTRFDEVMIEFPDLTYVFVYDKVEQEHINLFGKSRYKSYDSFRMMRKEYLFPHTKK